MADWSHLLIFRWAAWQILGVALFVVAWMSGLVHEYVLSDVSGISVIVCGVFLYALFVSGRASWAISGTLNEVKNSKFVSGKFRHRADLASESVLDTVSHYSEQCMMLGLIGTFYGFGVMLHALPVLFGSDQAAAASGLSNGAGAALYPSMIGCVASIWLGEIRQLLSKARVKLLTAMGEG